MSKIYLDMDGVLADFDKRAFQILGMDCAKYEFRFGAKILWDKLNAIPNFFYSFEPMPDLWTLWGAVRGYKPAVLTALPHTGADDVERQKRQWIAKYLGPDVQVITCQTKDKPNYCNPGDVLVDDRNINEENWIKKGGIFVHHFSALETLNKLTELKVI